MEILIPKKNVIIDSQILTALMGCPRLADFRFNHNLISINGKSNSLECGSIVHKFLEVYYACIINGMPREQAFGHAIIAAQLYIKGCPHCTDFIPMEKNENGVFVKIDKPICGHKVNDYPGVHNTPKEPNKDIPKEKYKVGWAWVLDTCEQYHNFYRNDHWLPLEVEVVKGEVLYEDDEIRVMWKAKLDSTFDTNQGIYPTDHKTMKQNRDTISLNNQFIGQCLIMKTRSVIINKVGFQRTLKAEEKFKRPMISYSAERLIEWQSETLPYYAKLLLMYNEAGHFPPNYTHCETKYGNCAFLAEVCSTDPGMREQQLKLHFKVGPVWNPTNEEDYEGEDE